MTHRSTPSLGTGVTDANIRSHIRRTVWFKMRRGLDVSEFVWQHVPWHYRAPRDTRTCFDMADVGDHSAWLGRTPYGTAHNALDDAISQAMDVLLPQWRNRVTYVGKLREPIGWLTYDEYGLDEEFAHVPLTDADLKAGCTQKQVYE